MHQLGPGRIVEVERRAAVLAEVPPGGAHRVRSTRGAARLVDGEMLLDAHLQGGVVARKVDGIAAATRRLAADRAVATHERHRGERVAGETERTAVPGTFENGRAS